MIPSSAQSIIFNFTISKTFVQFVHIEYVYKCTQLTKSNSGSKLHEKKAVSWKKQVIEHSFLRNAD